MHKTFYLFLIFLFVVTIYCEDECSEIKDPLFKKQFHIKTDSKYKTNIDKALYACNTGEGVTVGILDSGVFNTHDDLEGNYEQEGSSDYCTGESSFGEASGTINAGLISSGINNEFCGIGVAPKSKYVSRRVLCENITKESLVKALSEDVNFEISSNSWTLSDFPFHTQTENYCDYDEELYNALEVGTTEGRGGKGTIYVFPAGGDEGNVNSNLCFPTNQLHSIVVNSIPACDSITKDSHSGASIVVSVPGPVSDVDGCEDQFITSTTNENNQCIEDSTSRKSSAAILSGVIALILENNPQLYWHDVQSILIESANRGILQTTDNEEEWITNSLGIQWHPNYGFGMVDAEKAISLANVWKTELKTETVTYENDFGLLNVPKDSNFEHFVYGGVELEICVHNYYLQYFTFSLVSPSGTRIPFHYDFKGYQFFLIKNVFTFKGFYLEPIEGEWKLMMDNLNRVLDVCSFKLKFHTVVNQTLPSQTPTPVPSSSPPTEPSPSTSSSPSPSPSPSPSASAPTEPSTTPEPSPSASVSASASPLPSTSETEPEPSPSASPEPLISRKSDSPGSLPEFHFTLFLLLAASLIFMLF
ncbi:neuroendocrine convertase [Anaeramoeba flamelloides]|uniref:Neuroendocrine convertase n=1 Tax=Anaeramoeba flamelloides TaxID=1746091 RepID=A0AAV7ZW28_9EUKA|nr:neuroendocrine convertase [Anaeramoeba flamelloides]